MTTFGNAIPDRAVRIAAVAAMMDVSRDTVEELIKRGELPASRVSPRRIVVKISDVHAYMESRRIDARAATTSRALLDSVKPIGARG